MPMFPFSARGIAEIIQNSGPDTDGPLQRFAAQMTLDVTKVIVDTDGDYNLIQTVFAGWQRTFEDLMGQQYRRVQQRTVDIIMYGLRVDIGLNDPVMLDVLHSGGRRAGLIQVARKDRLFALIAKARAAGENPLDFAPRIAKQTGVSPGRARTIARTETKYAQNLSQLASYTVAGNVHRVEIVDGQLGSPKSDKFCIDRDGKIITLAEAQTLTATEHPNGTLNFSPIVERPSMPPSAERLADARRRLKNMPVGQRRALEKLSRATGRRTQRNLEG